MNTVLLHHYVPFPGISQYNPFIFTDGAMSSLPDKNEKTAPLSNHQAKKALNVIMADDDEDDRELFKEALEMCGSSANIQFAEDGRSLLQMLNDNREIPDLIFLDLNMPHKSGIECLAEIRQNQKLQHIPVVIYSTSSSLKDINDTFDKGANLYVKKPNSFSELRFITAKVLALNWNKYKPYYSRSQFLFSSKTD